MSSRGNREKGVNALAPIERAGWGGEGTKGNLHEWGEVPTPHNSDVPEKRIKRLVETRERGRTIGGDR